jgi:TonB family protein
VSVPILLAALSAAATATQELPPISQDLLNVSAISCVKMDNSGKVVGAYMIQSTGDAHRDREIVAWIKKLHWEKAKPGEKLRNIWFPMPIAFGDAQPPEIPASCPVKR